jgi:hypothetical protein
VPVTNRTDAGFFGHYFVNFFFIGTRAYYFFSILYLDMMTNASPPSLHAVAIIPDY